MPRSGGANRHVPALDGVRGIAILAVFIHHAAAWRSGTILGRLGDGGWMGVDLFFVLSGYLITGILMDARGDERYYRVFYARRIVRLVPALTAFLLVLLYVLPHTPLVAPPEATMLEDRQLWYWLYATNIGVALQGFGAFALGTGHLWSLAVEEQFYLAWPYVIARCARPAAVMRVAAAIIVAASVARVAGYLTGLSADAMYVLPMFRADALAWGALVAAAQRHDGARAVLGRWLPALALAGAALLAFVAVRLSFEMEWASPSMQILGYPALSMLCTAVVGMASQGGGPILRSVPLRFFGKISYALYLWHVPVIALLRQSGLATLPTWEFAAVALAVSLVPTMLSWWIVEKPALRLKRFVPTAGGRTTHVLAPVPEAPAA